MHARHKRMNQIVTSVHEKTTYGPLVFQNDQTLSHLSNFLGDCLGEIARVNLKENELIQKLQEKRRKANRVELEKIKLESDENYIKLLEEKNKAEEEKEKATLEISRLSGIIDGKNAKQDEINNRMIHLKDEKALAEKNKDSVEYEYKNFVEQSCNSLKIFNEDIEFAFKKTLNELSKNEDDLISIDEVTKKIRELGTEIKSKANSKSKSLIPYALFNDSNPRSA